MRYVVIPAYEPDEKLLELLWELKRIDQGQDRLRIVVVNDGSGEKYDRIFEAASKSAVVLSHGENRGKGAALKTAFHYIAEISAAGAPSPLRKRKLSSNDVVVTADADGQHRAEDIMGVCRACERAEDSIVTGRREFTEGVPLRSRMGNTITKYVFFLATGVKLGDTQCGLRAFPIAMLPFLCRIAGERYEYEMNLLMESALRIPILEEPIETVYIGENETSHFRTLQDSWIIYKEIFKFALSSIAGFLTDYISYGLLIIALAAAPTPVRLVVANVAARICSASLNFTLNKKYVFKSRESLLKSGIKYGLLAAGILGINTSLLLFLSFLGFQNAYLMKIIVELCLFLLSWTIQRRFVFKGKNPSGRVGRRRALYGHHKDL